VSKLLTHEFITEEGNSKYDKVDLIRTNALNYNQDMIKKIRKSTKDLVDSSPDSVGPSSKAKHSPKYLNMKDNMFNRTLRTSQNIKPVKDTSQDAHSTDKDVRNSVGSKSKLRQTFFKDKVEVKKMKDSNEGRETNGSASQSPRTILPISHSKAALGTSNNPHSHHTMVRDSVNNTNTNNTSRNNLKSETKSRSQSRNNLRNHNNKFSTNDIHQ